MNRRLRRKIGLPKFCRERSPAGGRGCRGCRGCRVKFFGDVFERGECLFVAEAGVWVDAGGAVGRDVASGKGHSGEHGGYGYEG